MSIVDLKDSPQVGELKFVRKSEPADKDLGWEDCAADGDSCACEDV